MAYRRRQGITRGATFKEEIHHQLNKNGGEHDHDDHDHDHHDDDDDYNHKKNINKSFSFGGVDHHNNNGSLAARAIRASAAHRDSSAYGYAYAAATADPSSSPPSSSSSPYSDQFRSHSLSKGSYLSESNSVKDPNDPKYGFWGILARKAKLILDEDDESSDQTKSYLYDREVGTQFYHPRQASESGARVDNARFRKGLDKITSSLNHIGDTLGNAFEEGRTMVEHKTADIIQETRNKTADIIQETRRIQIRRRGAGNSDTQDQTTVLQNTSWQRPVIQPVQTHALANQETQLKASRDVAMATAAKAKVLLRELKTVKADLAFAKERCAQLEEENKRLRENRDKGSNPADDDLIRLQLETLLAEKARLAHENSIYARENRFLREIVEYHQLTMQDVVYLDEGAEEVTEVYPYSIDDAKLLSSTPTSPISPSFFPEVSSLGVPSEMNEHVSEESEEICKPTTSLPSKPSPLQVCTNTSSTEKSESVKVPMSSETVADEKTEATQNTQPTITIAEDTKRY